MISTTELFSDAAKAGAFKRFPDGSVDFFESSDFTVDCTSVNLIGVLARGSYGVVYNGTLNGQSYAVKIEDFSTGVEEQVNLIVELTLLQSLPHDRMVRFYGAGYQSESLTGPKSMILMELLKNGTLRDVLKHNPPWNLLVRLLLDVARGIDFLHGLNIIHRDIKTTNVLVDEEWRGKLCDFSFACHEECYSKKEFIYGTDEFMSPEISLALDFDKSSDIFSFGIMLCEVLTLREPSAEFLCRKAQHMFALDEKELADAVMPGCPEELEALACLCCDVETTKRPTVQTCIEELEALLNNLGGPDFDYTPSDKPSKGPPTNGTLVQDDTSLPLSSLAISEAHRSSDNGNRGSDGSSSSLGGGGNAEVDARFALMDRQIQELRAENIRLSKDLRSLAVLLADKADNPPMLTDSSASFFIKPSRSSDAAPDSKRGGPYLDLNIGENNFQRIGGSEKNVAWTDTKREKSVEGLSIEKQSDPLGASKLSQALLLSQLDHIQNQLDATKKHLMSNSRRNSFSKLNPFVVGTPLSVIIGKSKSFSNLPSPTNPNSEPSPFSNHHSEDGTMKFSGKVVKSISEKSWDLNTRPDDQFKSVGRMGADIAEKKKKQSPRTAEEDSQNGLISAANRCRDMAQRNPVNTDLSTALDKYLNVVRKLSASAGRADIPSPDLSRCTEVPFHLGALFRSGSGGNGSNNGSSNNLTTISNEGSGSRYTKTREKQTTWRPSTAREPGLSLS